MKYAYARIQFDEGGWQAVERYTGEVFSLRGHRLHRPGAAGEAVSHPDSEMEIMIRYEEGSGEAEYVNPDTIVQVVQIEG